MIKRLPIDPFLLKLFATVALASLLPAQGWGVPLFQHITQIAIALLFFLHGARLSREAIWGGLSHWRLHLLILSVTFVLFPTLGSGVAAVLRPWLTDNLYLGILFLACLPSTVQSAVALTAMARGNVPVSICSASASTLLGVFITPLLVGIMLAGATSAQATVSLEAVGKIMLQLFFPFVFGHMLRPLIGAWVMKRQQLLKVVDQGSILLVVYTAFSGAVVGGLWSSTPLSALGLIVLSNAVLLTLAQVLAWNLGRWLGFSFEDRVSLLMCGSNKSLSSGIPIANVIFPSAMVGPIILPIMLFHQWQLLVCAWLAKRLAARSEN